MSQLFKDSFLVVSSKIISLALGFISSIFFIRLIGATGKGSLSVLEASTALFVLVTSVNLNLGIIHFVSKKKLEDSKILGISIIIFLISIASSILIIVFTNWIGVSKFLLPDGSFIQYAILLLIMIILLELKEIFSSFLKGLKYFKDLYRSTLIYSFFRLILFASLYYLHIKLNFEFSIIQLLFAHILCLFVMMASTFFFFYKEVKIKPNFHFNIDDLKIFMKYSGVGLLVILLGFFSRKTDIWIVDEMLGTQQLGFYAVAVSLGDLVMQIPMTLRNVLFPYLSSIKSKDQRINLLALFSRFNTTIVIALVLFLFLFSNTLIPIMYGEEFVTSVKPFQILIVGIAFLGFKSFFQVYMMSIEKQNFNVISNVIAFASLLVLDLYLIPIYGITGAAVGALISYVFSTIYIYYTLRMTERIVLHNFFIVSFEDINKIKRIMKWQ